MSPIPDFRSVPSSFVESKLGSTSPKFVFVSINNPKDIRHPRNQTTIRRQARKVAGRKVQRRERFEFVPEYVTKNPDVECTDLIPVHRSEAVVLERKRSDGNTIDNKGVHSRIDFNISLRPLGAGRGLNPLASFPIKSTPRVLQLINSCERSTYRWLIRCS
jgi:hypothetical protein